MTEHFVTIFNYNFIPQALALYKSMNDHIDDFNLWVICVDDKTKKFLDKKNYNHISTVSLNNLENEELRGIKKKRTIGEYIWTLTPFLPDWIFRIDSKVNRLTFLDADTFFLKNPKHIYLEYENSNKPILITRHNYDPIYDQSEKSGIYCVQFIIFDRLNGKEVRDLWKKECLDWCYNKFEDGKFGDQKYLDKWPEIFSSEVHVLSKDNAFQAPWNARVYNYSDATMWHFQGFRIIKKNKFVLFGNYKVPRKVINNVYSDYIKIIKLNLLQLDYEIIQGKNLPIINKIKSQFKFYLIYFKSFFR